MTVSVPEDKFEDIQAVLHSWVGKTSASKQQVQSLIGKLQFAARCVRPGRLFISRMLAHLRTLSCFSQNEQVPLSTQFLKDVHWWRTFMSHYNGISIIPQVDWSVPDAIISTDSSLTGCGGFSCVTGEFFHREFPEYILDYDLDINSLELLTVVIAMKLWGPYLHGCRIVILCDNMTSVSVLNSGRTRNDFLCSCLREVTFLCAVNEAQIRAQHISSLDNRLSDLLSRCHTDVAMLNEFLDKVGCNMTARFVPDELFNFSADW